MVLTEHAEKQIKFPHKNGINKLFFRNIDSQRLCGLVPLYSFDIVSSPMAV